MLYAAELLANEPAIEPDSLVEKIEAIISKSRLDERVKQRMDELAKEDGRKPAL